MPPHFSLRKLRTQWRDIVQTGNTNNDKPWSGNWPKEPQTEGKNKKKGREEEVSMPYIQLMIWILSTKLQLTPWR